MMARHLISFLVAFSLEIAVFAQTGTLNSDRSSLMEDYNAVINRLEVVYDFDIIKDSVRVTQRFEKEMAILTDYAKAFNDDYIYYDSFSSVENLEACTVVPAGKGSTKIPVSHFDESNDPGSGIFYDDSKTISFVYPSLVRGAVTSLSYDLVHNNPRFLRRVYFQSYLPIINGKVLVKANKDIVLGFRFFNCDDDFLQYREWTKGKYNYYEWTTSNVLPYKYLSSNNYGVLHHSPHAAIYIEQVHLKDSAVRYYSTVRDLYDFYYSLLPESDDTASSDLAGLVESLTAGRNEREKARAIYYWVQDNIKYVAYSDGYNGFVPALAEKVFSRRFGDCKGKASLIKKMMEMAGLKAYYAWVGTRDLPYSYSEMPLPMADNHMVVAYPSEDTIYIVDGTFRFIDFGMYPFNIQGKEALVSVDRDNYFLFPIPVSGPAESGVYDSVSFTLSGGTITGSGLRKHSGFNKYELSQAIEGVKVPDYNKRLSTLFSKGNNKFRVDSCRFAGLHEHDMPVSVSYSFSIDDYARQAGNDIYLNMNLDRSLADNKIDTTIRFAPVVNDFMFTEKQLTRFRIPEGYEISYLPDDDQIDNEIISASFSYSEEAGFVILEKELQYKFLLLSDDQIGIWNSVIDRLNTNYRQSVALHKSDN